ncbi:putative Heat shock protein DnaJ, cysteine-rich domain superfamily [Helianthus annuus]|nr:putative Heat shock protein DnaJ, cysteine-rich domain superfamily [Helianthus annuus]
MQDQIVSPPPPSLLSSSMNKKNTRSCDVCKAKGFYMCKLCKGNATIDWSPLYDPVFINPCLCPTCDGHRYIPFYLSK